ncbi:MAG: (2Fe-2S)-binding protein [Pseudomonadota bacterium]
MYVCICNNVTERDIHGAVAKGVRTISELRCSLNVSASCGQCQCIAEECLDEALAARREPDYLVALTPSFA